MANNGEPNPKRISRRVAMLGTAAAMAATPALAEVCPIGPPPHDKGPRVWMDMDQIELDAAYDQSNYAPLDARVRPLALVPRNRETGLDNMRFVSEM